MTADLIARLEAASEGGRELDCAIEIAVGGRDPSGELLGDEWHWNEWHPFGSTEAAEPLCQPMPHYTTSLDAALTLVPEGWFWRVGRTSLLQAWAGVYKTHPDHGEANRNDFYWHRDRGGPPSTPALALCIAALKARAA